MATRKKKRISKAWVADWEAKGFAPYKVAVQPVGDWVVVISPPTGHYSVTHRPSGLRAFGCYSLEDAKKVLCAFAKCERFTAMTWSKRLERLFKRTRDKALRS